MFWSLSSYVVSQVVVSLNNLLFTENLTIRLSTLCENWCVVALIRITASQKVLFDPVSSLNCTNDFKKTIFTFSSLVTQQENGHVEKNWASLFVVFWKINT